MRAIAGGVMVFSGCALFGALLFAPFRPDLAQFVAVAVVVYGCALAWTNPRN